MSSTNPVEPFEVAQMVELYVDYEHRDAANFSNREVLDESGVYSLHSFAAEVYAIGFNDGRRVESYRKTESRQRAKDRAQRESEVQD